MSNKPNPYDPPQTSQPTWLSENRSVMIQVGFVMQVIALLIDVVFRSILPRFPTWILSNEASIFHFALAAVALVGFAMVLVMGMTKSEWPLHQRFAIVALDALLLGLAILLVLGSAEF